MNVVAPPRARTRTESRPPEPAPRKRRRRPATLALAGIYLGACLVYGFQAWAHEVPWLFQDELVYASQAREYAATGDLTVRGEPLADNGLTARITSVAWRFDDPRTAYLAAKLLNVLLMAAACFPAYGLARLVVRRPAALFAAAGSVAIPGFVYASMILTEPLAYLLATTAFWLIARTLAAPRIELATLGWGAAALAVSSAGWQARSQLVLLFAVFGVASALRLLLSAPVRRRCLPAALGWAGLATALVLGYRAVAARDGYLLVVDGHWSVIGKMAAWGFGAFSIGLAVVPVVLGIAALWPSGGRRREGRHVAFSLVAATGILALVFYTAVKGGYLYFTFAWLVIERNLIYASPLLFVGAAIFLERRRVNPVALAVVLAGVTAAVYTVPYQLAFRIYADAPGLAVLSTANRHLQWTDETVRRYLAVVLAVALAAAVVPYLVRSRRALRAGAVVLGVAMVGAALTAEVAADRSSRGTATIMGRNLTQPYDWVHERTGGARTVLITQAVADANGIWLTQFFNPNVRYLASLDGTAPPPGPSITAKIVDDDGRLQQQFGDASYALVDRQASIAGEILRETANGTLYRIDRPLRLAEATYGVTGDGWTGESARHFRFWASGDGPGVARVEVSRAAWGGEDVPGEVTIRVAPVRWEGPHDGESGRLVPGAPFAVQRLTIHSRQVVEYLVPIPDGPPFVVELTVDPTFSPADFGGADTRRLGLQPSFEYLPGYELPRVVRTEIAPPLIRRD